MELDKETLIGRMQELASKFYLEDKSLEWLMEKNEMVSRNVANCERSAREIREYIINERDGREAASEDVKELKDELIEAIELQAELEKVVANALEAELERRLETK